MRFPATPVHKYWTDLKLLAAAKGAALQYDDSIDPDNGLRTYSIWIHADGVYYRALLYPIASQRMEDTTGYSAAQHAADLADFEANYKPEINRSASQAAFGDSRLIQRFGNLTTTDVAEVLVSSRPYVEPPSEAQRSVVSNNAGDSNASGSGAKQVRITYLNSSYVRKTEDVFTAGLTPVNTVGTDLRFIQSMETIKGADALGAVSLMTGTGGAGTAICAIAQSTMQTFMCHHYVPAGRRLFISKWGAVVDNNARFKLKGQARYGANLVDRILDLDNLTGIATAPGRLEFFRDRRAEMVGERTYVRVTVVPAQVAATVIRAYLDAWEDVL